MLEDLSRLVTRLAVTLLLGHAVCRLGCLDRVVYHTSVLAQLKVALGMHILPIN